MTATKAGTLTIPQRLLKAAASLPQPFHETDLIVCAWKDNPQLFGLRGREAEHPDANRARCAVQGKKGLVGRGWLIKAPKDYHYALSPAGAREASRLVNYNGTAARRALPVVTVPPALDDFLTRQFESEAYRRWVCGHTGRITAATALDWWGLTNKADAATVRAAIDFLAESLTDADDYVGHALRFTRPGESRRRAEGMVVDEEFLERLRSLDSFLRRTHGRKFGVDG